MFVQLVGEQPSHAAPDAKGEDDGSTGALKTDQSASSAEPAALASPPAQLPVPAAGNEKNLTPTQGKEPLTTAGNTKPEEEKKRTVWPISAPPQADAQRQRSQEACGDYPNNTLVLHFLHSAAANMLPLHSPLYCDNVPGMLFSSKDQLFAVAATDPQSRFGGRFPKEADRTQRHGTRPHAVMWRLNLHLKGLTTSSLDAQSDEACALLPYYTCSPALLQPRASSTTANGKADCLCAVSSALLADFRTDANALENASNNPAMAELESARQQMRWLPRDPFDGSEQPPGFNDKSAVLPRIIDIFNNSFSFGTAPFKSEAWQQVMANQLRASVLVTRVDDDDSSATDRNWLSGVVVSHRFAEPSGSLDGDSGTSAADVNKPPPLQQGFEMPIDLVLLQHGKPRAEAIGHLEPLLPATELFRKCAGASHPAFTGRPSAWFPFNAVRNEKRFGTPFYDGLINFDWNAVNWSRDGSSITAAAWGGQHAVMRPGSVIKYRSTDPMDSTLRQGVVLLTYVHLSSSTTQVWKQAALKQAGRNSSVRDAIEDFCTAFPLTPLASVCVWQLNTNHLAEGSTEWATQMKSSKGAFDATITMDRVHSVALPDPHNKLWEPVGAPRTVKHFDGVTARVKSSKRPAKLGSITFATRFVDTIVHEQTDRDAFESELVKWFRECQIADDPACRQLNSFYADLVASADGDFNSHGSSSMNQTLGPLQMLLNVRRLLNVPQRQTEPVRSRNPQPHELSAIFDPAPFNSGSDKEPAAASKAAENDASSAGRSSRGVAAGPTAGEGDDKGRRKRKAAAPEAAADAAVKTEPSDASVVPTKAKRSKAAPQQKVDAAALASLFCQLSSLDDDESTMPFAALVWATLPTNYSKEKRKPQLLKMETTARKEALLLLAQHDQPMIHALQYALTCCEANNCPHPIGSERELKGNAILAIRMANQCPNGQMPGSALARLHGIPTRAWMDHQGKQPQEGSPSVRARHRKLASTPAAQMSNAGTSDSNSFLPPVVQRANGPAIMIRSGGRPWTPSDGPTRDTVRFAEPLPPAAPRSDTQSLFALLQQHITKTDAAAEKAAEQARIRERALEQRLEDLSARIAMKPEIASDSQAAAASSSAMPMSGGRSRKRAAMGSGGTTPNSGASAGKSAAAAAAAPTSAPSPSAREQRLSARAEISQSGADETSTAVPEPPCKKQRAATTGGRGRGASSKIRARSAGDDATDNGTPATARALFGDEPLLQHQVRNASSVSNAEFVSQLSASIKEAVAAVVGPAVQSVAATVNQSIQSLQRASRPQQQQLLSSPSEPSGDGVIYIDTSSHSSAANQQVGFYQGQDYNRYPPLPPPPWQHPPSRPVYQQHAASYSQQQRSFPAAPQQYSPHYNSEPWPPSPYDAYEQSRYPNPRS